MTDDRHARALQAYAEAFARLTPAGVDALCRRVSAEVHFRDPFNDLHGREALRRLLLDMFERSGRPRFQIDEVCWLAEQQVGWLRWQFEARLPVIGTLRVEGASRVRLDAQGRVCEHLDYWDSAPVYLQLPWLGALLRRIRRRIALPQ